jgi:hypothetical protein
MATMVRKQIYLQRQRDEELKGEAKALGISEAELIPRKLEVAPSLDVSFRPDRVAFDRFVEYARTRRAKDSVESGRRWKREDLYEERLARYGKDRNS